MMIYSVNVKCVLFWYSIYSMWLVLLILEQFQYGWPNAYHISIWVQIQNILRSTSCRHRSEDNESDRCLIDIDLRVFAIAMVPHKRQAIKNHHTHLTTKWYTSRHHIRYHNPAYHVLHKHWKNYGQNFFKMRTTICMFTLKNILNTSDF